MAIMGVGPFHFVQDGIEAALERAFAAAGGADVRLGGGVATIQQYLRAGLVDDLHVAIVPILLGAGERLFDDLASAGALRVRRARLLAGRHPRPPRPQGVTPAPRPAPAPSRRRAAGAPI